MAAAAGAGALWWHQSRTARTYAALPSAFEADAEVVLHVAGHEARSRGQGVTSVHMLYGLLQDETVIQAITDAGNDPAALEDRTLVALDKLPIANEPDDIQYLYARALHSARSAERRVSQVDLWAYLAGSEAAAMIEAAGMSRVAILFRLVHKMPDPEPDVEPDVDVEIELLGDVHVVLRNDDYTTREFVCEILASVFTFNPADAEACMMRTHTEGRGVVGRFAAAEARTKIREVRNLARASGFPLWIGVEPI